MDRGNTPGTVGKKLRQLKRFFQLAVNRKQLDENGLRQVELPGYPKKKIEVYTGEECQRVLRSARNCRTENSVDWELLILVAIATGMRRAELLN